jgi:Tfp pilus tip-associated adhesin PilY1
VVADNDTNDVSVYLGTGAGDFATPIPFAVGLNPQDVAIADFDGDGVLDLAVADSGDGSVTFLFAGCTP